MKIFTRIMTITATTAACLHFLTACSSHPASPYAGRTNVEFDSAQLQMKNAEQMNAIVMKKIKKAEAIQKQQDVDDDRGIVAEPEAIEQLKDATRIVFARPDQDGSRETTFARLRRELTDLSSLDQVLQALTNEGLEALRSDSQNSAREQGTYMVLLNNLMAEIKPEAATNPAFRKIVETIRDAHIKVSDKVRNQQLMRSMSQPVSPSDVAAGILPKK
jgi:hypothetical protein